WAWRMAGAFSGPCGYRLLLRGQCMERTAHFATQFTGHSSGKWGVAMRKITFAGIVALCFVLAVTPVMAQEDSRFGVVEGFWFPDLTCALGAGWERIIFDWAQHQPEKPEDWHTLNVDDRWLKAANACNRDVVAILKNTPAWATDGIAGAGVPRGLYLPVDDAD